VSNAVAGRAWAQRDATSDSGARRGVQSTHALGTPGGASRSADAAKKQRCTSAAR
jgi:hypothetical protein